MVSEDRIPSFIINFINGLPKTRSGKIPRKLLREIAGHDDCKIPSIIDDHKIIDEIENVYKTHKVGTNKKQLK